MAPLEIITHSPAETAALGETLGRRLSTGVILALEGPLGAGKTQFVQGLARGLGVNPAEPIVSPTFVLLREYAGRLPLYHFDLYRLADADELFLLGFEEITTGRENVVAIEWPERAATLLPPESRRIQFAHHDESRRRLTLNASAAALLSDK